MRVLILCAGNTCRSPMAAALLRGIAQEAGLAVEVQSAGLDADEGSAAHPNAVLAMAAAGHDISDHRAQQLTAVLIDWADVIVPMQQKHGVHVAGKSPTAVAKMAYLTSDVRDPFDGPLEDYERCRDTLRRLLGEVVRDRLEQRRS